MKIRKLILASAALCVMATASANRLTVKMNSVSTTMTLKSLTTGKTVDTGAPEKNIYEFDCTPGQYILTGIAKDGKTVNGTIEVCVGDSVRQQITVLTNTAYATNTSDGIGWSIANGDYTLSVDVSTGEGIGLKTTLGNSVTANRYTFLCLNACTYHARFSPSDARRAEGYTDLYKSATLTGNSTVAGKIPMGENYVVTTPKDAVFELNMKFAHFTDFTRVEPVRTETKGDITSHTYYLAQGQVYNYRTSMEGALTRGGYFTMAQDPAKRPQLAFTTDDYKAFGPHTVNHSAQSNNGYETGDIFVNINQKGFLKMKAGETFKAHAMRTWQLTDIPTNNYFIDPDYHYTVLGLDGKPSSDVIEITAKEGSSWADIKAVGNGTVIVLVTYDAIGLNYYSASAGAKTPYLGGEYWGAIWPENTAAYVVNVGGAESAVTANMFLNRNYKNDPDSKSVETVFDVDAEHDVFYYLDTEEGYSYTFMPEGAAEVTMAYPTIGTNMATYSGFGNEGVTANADGSYTLLLKHGRQIVRLADAAGNATYQVLTAKKCHREITNLTREGSTVFRPGDEIRIQYSGLFHPANKLAGIYDMSAYVTYNDTPNGSSLILGPGQYTFGSSSTAQATTIKIPDDYDVTAHPVFVMDEGVIQKIGYGDPAGSHRNISPSFGRSPNFTATVNKEYFGALPEVRIPLNGLTLFDIKVVTEPAGLEYSIKSDATGEVLTAGTNGLFSGTYGSYSVTGSNKGYHFFEKTFTIAEDAEGLQTFALDFEYAPGCWDGETMTEPQVIDGVYQISNGNELAWFANHINSSASPENASKTILTADIDLGGYPWTPIGSTSKKFAGSFDGQGHKVEGLRIMSSSDSNSGLFGYVQGTPTVPASICGVSVYGKVDGRQTCGGVAGNVWYTNISRCANHAGIVSNTSTVTTNVGGIAGYLGSGSVLSDCCNTGNITGALNAPYNVGGIVGAFHETARIENTYNAGTITGRNTGSISGSTNAQTSVNFANNYADADFGTTGGYTLVTDRQMASGEVAYRLGKAFGQKIGTDPYPVIGGVEVFFNEQTQTYYNDDSGITDVEADTAVPVLYYNMQGMSSERPFMGLNIVLMTDGTVRKIVQSRL